jgi:hypothetical protein
MRLAGSAIKAVLHELVALERFGRIGPGMRDRRIAFVIKAIVDGEATQPDPADIAQPNKF